MKTIRTLPIAIMAAILLTLSGNPVMATENLEVITINDSKTIRMKLNVPTANEVKVKLLDEADRVLYNDQISVGSTFEDNFDFSTVKEGVFTLVSEMGNMRYNRILRVYDNEVEIAESYYSFIPEFKVEGEFLRVHFINNLQNNIGISIEDNKGTVFDDFYEGTEAIFSSTYGLRNMSRGDYTINLMSGGEMFSYEFSID